jgi:DNA mismatch repair protein MutS
MTSKKENIVDFYLKNVAHYNKIYGEKTIVFLESGHFMELYDYVSEKNSAHFKVCYDILNIIVTRRDKSDPNSAYMAGIPTLGIKRYQKILLKHNYTVVMITQVSPPPNVKREVTQILSPGCNLVEEQHNDVMHPVTFSVLIEIDEEGEFFIYTALYNCDLGHTEIESIYPDEKNIDNENLLYTLKQKINTHHINEIIINYKNEKPDFIFEHFRKSIIDALGIKSILTHFNNLNETTFECYMNKNFQAQLLETIYPHFQSPFYPIQQNLGLECVEHLSLTNLLILLDFLKHHDKILIENLSKPQWINSNTKDYLHLYNDAFEKLDIFPFHAKDTTQCLLHYIDKTQTKPGSRLLVNHLKYPLLNKDDIEFRYNCAEEILQNQNLFELLEKNLKIIDYEKIYRRISIAKLQPYEIPKLIASNNCVTEILNTNMNSFQSVRPTPDAILLFAEHNKQLQSWFDVDKCSTASLQTINSTIFNKGQFPHIDNLIVKIEDSVNLLTICKNHFNNLLFTEKVNKTLQESVTVRSNDKDGYWLEISRTKYEKLKTLCTQEKHIKDFLKSTKLDLQKIEYDLSCKTNIKIYFPEFKKLSHTLLSLQNTLIENIKSQYFELLFSLHKQFYNAAIKPCYETVTFIDVMFSNAKVAKEYHYCKPVVLSRDTEDPSSLSTIALRHPIIERIIHERGIRYVDNDIEINDQKCKLLYGVNSVGKSSLLKSIATAIVMSQAGMFVSAKEFSFSPYDKIFTRTGNSDNLFNHHSSFVKEMSETKQIIKLADQHSLVVADELCSSTEIDSATQIVAAVLAHLSAKKTSFIFATHLFTLQNTPLLKELQNIENVHLKVHFENNLVFERKINKGLPESTNYGLLVAKKIIDSTEFSKLTNVSKEYVHRDVNPHSSRYNKRLFVETCKLCSYKPLKQTDLPLDTHHIDMQCNSDAEGFIDYWHKNTLHNLVVLCKQCHQNVHKGLITITGYKETSDGKILEYVKN